MTENSTMLLIKPRLSLMMFLQYAIWGAWLPILYPFLIGHRGFNLEQTGACLAAGAVGAIFGPFLVGQLADRTFSTERLLFVSHLVGAVLVWMLAEVESFNLFLALSLVYGFVYAPTISLTNSITLANIRDRDRDFGPIRLWGTLGWIAAGILVGQYLLRFAMPEGLGPEETAASLDAGRAMAFRMSAVIGVVMAFYCLSLPHTPPAREARDRFAWAEALGEIRLQPLLTLFLVAVPVSMIHQFYFVYTAEFVSGIQTAADSEGANKFANAVNQVLGVGGGGLMTIGQMSEIVVLALMPLLTKVFNRKALLCIGLLAYGLRMAVFAYLPGLVPVLFGVALHGFCFGCFIFVAYMVVDEHTSKDVRATAQNLFNLVIIGIGIIVGSYFATGVIGQWATVDGEIDFVRLFSFPMWIAAGSLLVMLVAYPNRARPLEAPAGS